MHAAIVSVAKRGDGAVSRPFRYGSGKCSAKYVTQMEDMGRREIDNAINCQCEQEYGAKEDGNKYTVTVGSFGYLIRNGGGGGQKGMTMKNDEGRQNHEEQTIVRKCLSEALPNLTRMCKVQSVHFSLLVAHWFEACCKRARARARFADGGKFVCKSIVPDDVTPFMS